jgi:hypothetical protein
MHDRGSNDHCSQAASASGRDRPRHAVRQRLITLDEPTNNLGVAIMLNNSRFFTGKKRGFAR